MVVFDQSGCIRAKWLYSIKIVVIGQNLLYSCKSGCIPAKLLYYGKVFVFGQASCVRAS